MENESFPDRALDWIMKHVMAWFFLIVFVGLAVVLAGWGVYGINSAIVVAREGRVTHGIIVERHHYAAYTSSIKGVTSYHPESWEVLIYGPHDKSGRGDTETYYLRGGFYEQTRLGDRFSYDSQTNRCESEHPQ